MTQEFEMFVVVTDEDVVLTRSAFPTERGAKVNAITLMLGVNVMSWWTDEIINEVFDRCPARVLPATLRLDVNP